jgi:hypothetical protein
VNDPTELDELHRRTRDVEDEIEATRARIEGLLGVGSAGSSFGARWRDRWVVEVQRELPPLERDAAHEALVEAMHGETGLVGAVRRRGSELEWKPFFAPRGNEQLEVCLEGSDEAPTLRLRGTPVIPESRAANAAIVTAAMLLVALAGLVAGFSPIVLAGTVLLLGLLAVVTGVSLLRRQSRRAMSAMARRVGDAVVSARPRVRVDVSRVDVESALEEEVQARDVHAAKEVHRGVP